MGLFDSVYGADPRTQGLLAAGAAMMGGPSRLPVSLGQSIGQGYMAGNQAYQQAMQLEAQRKQQEEQAAYRAAQIDKMKADAARKDQMESAIRGLLGGGPAAEAPGSLVSPPVGQSGPDSQTLQKVGTAMLIGGDPRGSGILELGKQRSMAEERAKEMQAMTATGTTKQNPTPEEAAIPVQAGAAERFMGPEAKVIPGLHQRAIALGNWIQRNPSGDPAYAKKELAAMDKMVEDYNAKMTADNSAYQREEENRRAAEERANAERALRQQLADAEMARKRENDAAKAAEAAKGKALPQPAVTKLAGAGDAVETSKRLLTTFKDNYGNKTIAGDLSNTTKRIFGDDTGQAQWWQDMEQAQNRTRHELFGSALTATELAAWNKTSVNPRMDSKQIKENLTRRAEIEARAASKLARSYEAAGYSKDQIRELLGTAAEYLDKPAAPVGGAGIPSAADIDAELARRKAARQLKGN